MGCLNGLAGLNGVGGLNGLAGRTIPLPHCVARIIGLEISFAGFAGVFAGALPPAGVLGLTVAEAVLLGDGVGGNTLVSFPKKILTGVLGLELCLRCLTGIGLRIVGDALLSSGNSAKFSRRRTAYKNQFCLGSGWGGTWMFRGVHPP